MIINNSWTFLSNPLPIITISSSWLKIIGLHLGLYNTSVKYYSQSNKKEQLSGDPELLWMWFFTIVPSRGRAAVVYGDWIFFFPQKICGYEELWHRNSDYWCQFTGLKAARISPRLRAEKSIQLYILIAHDISPSSMFHVAASAFGTNMDIDIPKLFQ